MAELFRRIPFSQMPFCEYNCITSYTSSEWTTLLDLQVDPDYAYYVFDVYVIVDSIATPEGYIRIYSNGEPLIRGIGTIGGFGTYYWGQLRFIGKYQKSPMLVQVRSDGSTSMDAYGWISGIKVPIKELEASE